MDGRDEKGRFATGNRIWEARSSAGPKPKFIESDALWAACAEYFEWVEENPLLEDKLVAYQGKATHEPVKKMRAMTVGGLCVFLDISVAAWHDWKKSRSDLIEVITRVEEIIRAQKFAGAAADLLNPNIIARDLGLAEKREVTGKGGGPVETREVGPTEAARLIAFALRQGAESDASG